MLFLTLLVELYNENHFCVVLVYELFQFSSIIEAYPYRNFYLLAIIFTRGEW